MKLVPSLQLGGLQFQQLPVYLEKMDNKRHRKLVGMRIFQNFEMLYFAKTQTFWLRPYATPYQTGILRYSLRPVGAGRYVVQALTLPAPAGLSIGDTVRLGPGQALPQSALTELLPLPETRVSCGSSSK